MSTKAGLSRNAAKQKPSVSPSAPTLKAYAADIYAKLTQDGCGARDIVNVSSELLHLVTERIVSGKALGAPSAQAGTPG